MASAGDQARSPEDSGGAAEAEAGASEAPPAGEAALAAWAGARRGELAAEAQRRTTGAAQIDRALELVRDFIRTRGLILFGGLAIDYALRQRGFAPGIYPEGLRPDFDCYSPRSVDDAYDLVDLLARAGFERPGAVRGIHVQTMRVRAAFTWVADFGYAPREVFDRIPTFEYRGLRVVHPDYQRMDMHLAFCFPFNDPPREDVFHRWRKDLARFALLEAHCPWASPAPGKAPGTPAHRTLACRIAVPIVGRGGALPRVALHGFAAYAATRAALDELGAALGMASRRPTTAPPLALRLEEDACGLTVESPAGDAVALASPWPEDAVAGQGTAKAAPRWFDPYMDAYPETVRAGGAMITSTRGRLLAATLVRVGGRAPGEGPGGRAFVVSPQFLLLWLAFEAHRADDGSERNAYRAYYAHTLDILRSAEDLYAEALDAAASPEERGAVMGQYLRSPFAPTVDTIGDTNLSAAYLVKTAAAAERLGGPLPAGSATAVAAALRGLPQNYNAGPGRKRPAAFDYGGCVLFRRAGAPRPTGEGH